MTEDALRTSWQDRVRWWIYERCLAYCVHIVYPTADPSEFSLIDNAEFVAISKDEIREIIEEAPEVAWHFSGERS